jgi:hypothetical protein
VGVGGEGTQVMMAEVNEVAVVRGGEGGDGGIVSE